MCSMKCVLVRHAPILLLSGADSGTVVTERRGDIPVELPSALRVLVAKQMTSIIS